MESLSNHIVNDFRDDAGMIDVVDAGLVDVLIVLHEQNDILFAGGGRF